MAKIKLTGMQFYAYHGCFPEEKLVGNDFLVDCYFKLDANHAAKTDDLKNTIDYQKVYQVIAKEMEQPSSLLENVVYRILKSLYLNFPTMKKANISIKKINPQLGGKIENVSVEMTSEEVNYIYKKNSVINEK